MIIYYALREKFDKITWRKYPPRLIFKKPCLKSLQHFQY